MSNKKDELITGAELARRISKTAPYITKLKKNGKLACASYGKKFYYRKCCDILGIDPDDPHKSIQSDLQKEVSELNKQKDIEVKSTKQKVVEIEEDSDEDLENAESLLKQIEKAVLAGGDSVNRNKLDVLRLKAGVLREYFTARNEQIKNRKLEENLFDRGEVVRILSFAMNMVRNSLINLPNNYAVSLEGLSQKEIKDFATDDVNKILEDLQNVEGQFD